MVEVITTTSSLSTSSIPSTSSSPSTTTSEKNNFSGMKYGGDFLSVTEIFENITVTIEESQPMLSQLLNGYLTLFCVGSGVILNILCIYVFLKYRNGSPVIQYYLVTLTLWQTALLCNAFLLYCLPTLIYGHVVSSGYYVFVYPFVYAFANTTHTGTVWIILTLTIDRYLALCQPLKHRAIGKRSRVKRLMVAVSILAIFFSVPRFFEVATIYDRDPETNEWIPVVSRTAIVDDKTYWTVYHIILAMLFVTLVPCLLLFALTLRISIALRQAIVRRKALCAPTSELDGRNKKAACSKKEHRANIMLCMVIAKFLVSDVLPAIIDVLEHIVGTEIFMSSPMATLFVDISNFLVVLNCSTNFWIFLFWGKRFRKSCRHMLIDSWIGRRMYSWAKISESDLASYFNQPSSFTTNYTKNKNGIYSDAKSLTPKRSFAPAESTILLLSSENGLLQEPLLKVSKKFSQQNCLIPNPTAKNYCRANSCNLSRLPNIINNNNNNNHSSQDYVIRNSLELEKQAMLNILASQKR